MPGVWCHMQNPGSKAQCSTSKPLRQDTNQKQLSRYVLQVHLDAAIIDCGHNYGYNIKVMSQITNVSDTTNESNCLSQILGSLRSTNHLYKWEFPQILHRPCRGDVGSPGSNEGDGSHQSWGSSLLGS